MVTKCPFKKIIVQTIHYVNSYMNRQILIFLHVFCFTWGQPELKQFNYGGIDREYYLYIPDSVQPEAPLVFVFHGYTSSATIIMNYSGFNNIAEENGLSRWITNKDSRNSNYKMRSNCDAIMVGTKTILEDNPTLTSHGFGRDPKIVIIDMGKKLSKKENVFNHNPIVFSEDILGENPLNNVEIILNMLYKESIQSLYIEGGGETISHFIDSNLFDELQIYYAPKLIGKGRTLYKGFKGINDNINLKVNRIEKFGDDIKITYHR